MSAPDAAKRLRALLESQEDEPYWSRHSFDADLRTVLDALAARPTDEQIADALWSRLEDETEGSLHLDLNVPEDSRAFQALVSDLTRGVRALLG